MFNFGGDVQSKKIRRELYNYVLIIARQDYLWKKSFKLDVYCPCLLRGK